MAYLKSNDLFAGLTPEHLFERVPHPMVIADHLMTPDNIGAMIRLADNIGATEVCFLGKEDEHRLGKVRRAAASSRDNIRWYFSEETDLRKIIPNGKKIVAIETSDNATCIYDTELPENVAFIVDSERNGLSDELLAQCDMVVYIPVPGPTRSLNVSHAAAVVLFEWQRQMLSKTRSYTETSLRAKTRNLQNDEETLSCIGDGGCTSAMTTIEKSKITTKYKHIFFDLDRTLWDFDAAAEVAFERIYEKYNLKSLGIPCAHEFHEVYHPLNEQLWELYREDKITKADLNRTRFLKPLEHYGIHDVELADHLSEDYVYWSPRIVRLVPGTMELLDYLKPKYHLHLITNGFQEVQHTKLSGSGLEPYFETLTVSEEVGVKKPNPEIFHYALRKANATTEESIVIGDEMAVDIDGARAAGIDQIFFNPSGKEVEGERTFEVKDLREIKEIL
ncbi:MAG: YjjG family noncanonical pyrimidine nucleotidase [Bacteroidales bacterium]|nr:YjjG family noncanonical pyrimidine nucleotidase [Bacteroidales bacterium]